MVTEIENRLYCAADAMGLSSEFLEMLDQVSSAQRVVAAVESVLKDGGMIHSMTLVDGYLIDLTTGDDAIERTGSGQGDTWPAALIAACEAAGIIAAQANEQREG